MQTIGRKIKMQINDMHVSERPMEKLERYGKENLSDAELFAIIFRTGIRKTNAVELAREMLMRHPNGHPLVSLYQDSLLELQEVSGIGKVKAAQVHAVLELSKRIAKQGQSQNVKITSASAVARLYMEDLRHLRKECFKVIYLDTKNQVIADENISIGSLNASIVHPREVFKNAVKRSANSIIAMHNHPSGDPTPSKEDVDITRRIRQAGELLGITLLDHIIIGDHKYISFKEEKLL